MKRAALECSLESRAMTYLFALGAGTKKRGQDGELDQEVFWGQGRCMWLEFKKDEKAEKRAGQKVWIKYLVASGYEALFIESWGQFVDVVEMWRLIYGEPTAHRDAAFNPTRRNK